MLVYPSIFDPVICVSVLSFVSLSCLMAYCPCISRFTISSAFFYVFFRVVWRWEGTAMPAIAHLFPFMYLRRLLQYWKCLRAGCRISCEGSRAGQNAFWPVFIVVSPLLGCFHEKHGVLCALDQSRCALWNALDVFPLPPALRSFLSSIVSAH